MASHPGRIRSLLNVSFAKFHGENDEACGRVCHGTFCLVAGPFRCCWRPMSNLQLHPPRGWKGDTASKNIPEFVMKLVRGQIGQIPRIWPQTSAETSTRNMLRLGAGHEAPVSHQLWNAGPNEYPYTFLRLLGFTNRCHYTPTYILCQTCIPLYLILSLYAFGKQQKWFDRLPQLLVVVLPMRLTCIARRFMHSCSGRVPYPAAKKLFMTSSSSKFNSVSEITCDAGPHVWSSAKNWSFEGIPRHSKVVSRNQQNLINSGVITDTISAENRNKQLFKQQPGFSCLQIDNKTRGNARQENLNQYFEGIHQERG